jgi:hypothetical protein
LSPYTFVILESDEAGRALGIVQCRSGKEEFDIAVQLANSSIAHERRVAADILAHQAGMGRASLNCVESGRHLRLDLVRATRRGSRVFPAICL